jgi:hypothetical protein
MLRFTRSLLDLLSVQLDFASMTYRQVAVRFSSSWVNYAKVARSPTSEQVISLPEYTPRL